MLKAKSSKNFLNPKIFEIVTFRGPGYQGIWLWKVSILLQRHILAWIRIFGLFCVKVVWGSSFQGGSGKNKSHDSNRNEVLLLAVHRAWTAIQPVIWHCCRAVQFFLMFGFPECLWLLGNLIHLLRSRDFNTYPQHNTRLNNHLRVDAWLMLLLALVVLAFPRQMLKLIVRTTKHTSVTVDQGEGRTCEVLVKMSFLKGCIISGFISDGELTLNRAISLTRNDHKQTMILLAVSLTCLQSRGVWSVDVKNQWCSPRDQGLGLEVPRGQKHKSWSWSWQKSLEHFQAFFVVVDD